MVISGRLEVDLKKLVKFRKKKEENKTNREMKATLEPT